ncbi:MAG: ribosome small subunit-dependent GTPase A [Candidatus Hydrogenedentota bacterium]
MNNTSEMLDLGWSDALNASFQEIAANIDGAVAVRIVREDRGLYRAISEGETLLAEITGAYRYSHSSSEDHPAVGDWVVATRVEGEDKLRIHDVLPRKTVFKRTQPGTTSDVQVVAANVDTVFIVMGVDGDFNPRRAERYIALAYESGATPVVLLSKSDLAETLDEFISTMESAAIGVSVHTVSSLEGDGIETLRPYIQPGKTVACLGSSGAGKSTLINALLGETVMDTGDVREDDSRGRHTTTHRQLVMLPDGGAIIDTPGMRELQMTGDEASLDAAFEDVESLIESCRFNNCSHDSEPGCAVLSAIEEGELDPARYKSYQKLQRELAYVQRRQNESSDHEQRQRGKSLNKLHKRIQNEKKNRFRDQVSDSPLHCTKTYRYICEYSVGSR